MTQTTSAPQHDQSVDWYVESVISSSIFWVDLGNLDFSDGRAVMRLELGVDKERVLSGEVAARFDAAPDFAFHAAQ